jgi:hypothetical protein
MMILNLTPKPKQYSTKTFLEWVNPLRLVERLIIPGIVTPKKIGRRQGQNMLMGMWFLLRKYDLLKNLELNVVDLAAQ